MSQSSAKLGVSGRMIFFVRVVDFIMVAPSRGWTRVRVINRPQERPAPVLRKEIACARSFEWEQKKFRASSGTGDSAMIDIGDNSLKLTRKVRHK